MVLIMNSKLLSSTENSARHYLNPQQIELSGCFNISEGKVHKMSEMPLWRCTPQCQSTTDKVKH